MRRILGIQAALALLCGAAMAQSADEPVTVSADHPRLFLRPARLRLLKRERERTSMRWQQFELLMAGKAPMPEPGLALALYYQVSGNADAGRQAIARALGRNIDLRQQALVFDWCQDLLTEDQRGEMIRRLQQGIATPTADDGVAAVRSRVLAAVALFDHVPKIPERELEHVVRDWWGGKIVPALKNGRAVIRREDAFPLFELLHAIRDNTNLDLRESLPQFFKDYPIEHLLSYYPLAYEGPDAEYYIGAGAKTGDPDLNAAALSRVADMEMVAYDTNAPESQVLQGWLMHDRFMLRGTFGAPYEFLWANPYQPGLSYYHVPLIYYNPQFGRLFIRSSWEDTAKWFGCFDGAIQVFDQGQLAAVDPQKDNGTFSLGEAVVYFARTERKFTVRLGDEEDALFVLGLEPHKVYEVEIDDEEMCEATTDAGGILQLDVPRGRETGVRLREKRSTP
jgi:hypothetical protein